MARLIDADNLVDELGELADSYADSNCSDFTRGTYNICRQQGVDAAIEVVKIQMPIDPVKHGRWIEGCPTETTDYFNCSVCNAGIFVNNLWRVSYEDVSEIHRYCHNCGAKMDEVDK